MLSNCTVLRSTSALFLSSFSHGLPWLSLDSIAWIPTSVVLLPCCIKVLTHCVSKVPKKYCQSSHKKHVAQHCLVWWNACQKLCVARSPARRSWRLTLCRLVNDLIVGSAGRGLQQWKSLCVARSLARWSWRNSWRRMVVDLAIGQAGRGLKRAGEIAKPVDVVRVCCCATKTNAWDSRPRSQGCFML